MNYLDLAKQAISGHHEDDAHMEDVLKGIAVELWSNEFGELFLVSDEADAAKLTRQGIQRGAVYTASEVRHVITIADRQTVAEIHAWKRDFDAIIGDQGVS